MTFPLYFVLIARIIAACGGMGVVLIVERERPLGQWPLSAFGTVNAHHL
jgi:hypothetical protein